MLGKNDEFVNENGTHTNDTTEGFWGVWKKDFKQAM